MVQKIIFDKAKNKEERMWFIRYWANYVRTHKDEEWSEQQAILICQKYTTGF